MARAAATSLGCNLNDDDGENGSVDQTEPNPTQPTTYIMGMNY